MGGSTCRVGAVVGRVVAIRRYPVKSMEAEVVAGAELSWHGVAGDRRWGLVRDRGGPTGFPWLTIRQRPDMVRYRPRFADPERPDTSPVLVTMPNGAEVPVTDPALAADLGGGARALKLDRGAFDSLPLSLVTVQSVRSLGRLVGRPLAVGRFRPNLVIDARPPGPDCGHEGDGGGFPEDGWPGCTLRIGDALVRVDARDRRCVVVGVDPTTAERDPDVLRAVARRGGRLGVYGTVGRPGRVAAGDPVVLAALPVPVGGAAGVRPDEAVG